MTEQPARPEEAHAQAQAQEDAQAQEEAQEEAQEDWWEETPLNEGAFWQAFGGKDVLLDYVEYDGRFHKRTDALFGLSLDYYHRFEKWQYVFGGQYLDSRFKKLKRAKRK